MNSQKEPVKLKIYRTVVRPALVYGAETRSTTKGQEKRLEVNEMTVQRWMCGVTKRDEDAEVDVWSHKER